MAGHLRNDPGAQAHDSFGQQALNVAASILNFMKIFMNTGNTASVGWVWGSQYSQIESNPTTCCIPPCRRSPGYSRGVDLIELAESFQELGCADANNLDGGRSFTIYFMGRLVNKPQGRNRERGTSDILFIE